MHLNLPSRGDLAYKNMSNREHLSQLTEEIKADDDTSNIHCEKATKKSQNGIPSRNNWHFYV